MHTYFKVGDITETRVLGLEQKNYIDKLDVMNSKNQRGAVTITDAVDRIYTGVNKPLSVEDRRLDRTIHINSSGSSTAVVWNPWIKQSAEMADFKDDEYQRMLCVETANAGPELITLSPGASYELAATYAIESTGNFNRVSR